MCRSNKINIPEYKVKLDTYSIHLLDTIGMPTKKNGKTILPVRNEIKIIERK